MKPSWRGLLLVSLMVVTGCSSGSAPPELTTSTHYQQLLEGYDTLAACEQVAAVAPSGFFNCTRQLTLCTNGGYSLIVTDVVNEGIFHIADVNIHAEQKGAGDGPTTFDATFNANHDVVSTMLSGTRPYQAQVETAAGQAALDATCASFTQRTWW